MTQAAVNNAIVLYRLSVKREDVENAQKLFFTAPQLQDVLENPTVSLAKKYEIIEKVFALENTPDVIVNFMKMMCRLGHCSDMKDIFESYYKNWDEQNHILRAQLISAAEPTDEEISQAKQLLQNKYPKEQIDLTEKVDESLLGGYVIKALHEEYDRSYEGRLRQLERKLTGR